MTFGKVEGWYKTDETEEGTFLRLCPHGPETFVWYQFTDDGWKCLPDEGEKAAELEKAFQESRKVEE